MQVIALLINTEISSWREIIILLTFVSVVKLMCMDGIAMQKHVMSRLWKVNITVTSVICDDELH